MTLIEILLTLGVITFIVYAIFNVIYLVDVRKTSSALRQFIIKTEENLNPALAELTRTLEDIKKVTGDISMLVERLRAAIGVILSLEKGIERLRLLSARSWSSRSIEYFRA
jgi:hypothetical protein